MTSRRWLNCSQAVALLTVSLMLIGASNASASLFGADFGNNQLVTIDTATGATTVVGAFGFQTVLGLAFDPDSRTLFGLDTDSDQLLTIDTATGAATAVGGLGFGAGFGLARSLAFDPGTGTLFSARINTSELLTIDTATGAATAVGAFGSSGIRSLAFDPGSDTLFGVDNDSDQLLTIDTATGAATAVGGLGPEVQFINAITFDPSSSTLFGVGSTNLTNRLLTIDPATGMTTIVGGTSTSLISGLAFAPETSEIPIPEPATLALFGLGLAGLAGLRRRTRGNASPPDARFRREACPDRHGLARQVNSEGSLR